jgi:hypothetical protein
MATTGRSLRRAPFKATVHHHRSWHAIVGGFAPILVLYFFYTAVRWIVTDRGSAVADRNADWVLRFERTVGIDWEAAIQGYFINHSRFITAANFYYVYAFFPVLIGGALIALFRAPAVFNHWRSVFIVSLLIALVGFTIFPLTPPRLLPAEAGYVDTLLVHGPQYYGDERGASLFNGFGSLPDVVNVYAAMPSMHVGWSLLAGLLVIASFPGRLWLALLAYTHVVLMGFVVVVTANHYVIDGIVGVLVLALAAVIVRLWGQIGCCIQKLGQQNEPTLS